MSLTPLSASGGKESGSGKVEQLLAFGPQINGLPTILEVNNWAIDQLHHFVVILNIELKATGNPEWAYFNVLADILGKEPLRLL